jgi:hypothetical protein
VDLKLADYRAYAKAKTSIREPDAWASTHFDLRDRDELVREWLDADKGETPRAERRDLTPDELQEQVNVVAAMLEDGQTLPQIQSQLGRAIKPAQWAQIASTARAQAKPPKLDTAGESPPTPSANVSHFPNRMQAQKG